MCATVVRSSFEKVCTKHPSSADNYIITVRNNLTASHEIKEEKRNPTVARITPNATYMFKVKGVKYYLVKNKTMNVESFTTQDGDKYFHLNSDKYFKIKGHITTTMKAYGDNEEIVAEKLTALIQGLQRRLT